MNDFQRTAMKSETHFRNERERNDVKYCKEETSNSINHLMISFEKLIDNLQSDDLSVSKHHIDNVYYHIGKIKGLT